MELVWDNGRSEEREEDRRADVVINGLDPIKSPGTLAEFNQMTYGYSAANCRSDVPRSPSPRSDPLWNFDPDVPRSYVRRSPSPRSHPRRNFDSYVPRSYVRRSLSPRSHPLRNFDPDVPRSYVRRSPSPCSSPLRNLNSAQPYHDHCQNHNSSRVKIEVLLEISLRRRQHKCLSDALKVVIDNLKRSPREVYENEVKKVQSNLILIQDTMKEQGLQCSVKIDCYNSNDQCLFRAKKVFEGPSLSPLSNRNSAHPYHGHCQNHNSLTRTIDAATESVQKPGLEISEISLGRYEVGLGVAKSLTTLFFGNEDVLICFDMLEAKSHKNKVESLTGENHHFHLENRGMVNANNEVVIAPFAGEPSPEIDSHTGPCRINPVHDLKNRPIEISQSENADNVEANWHVNDVEWASVEDNQPHLGDMEMVNIENEVEICKFQPAPYEETTPDADYDGRNRVHDLNNQTMEIPRNQNGLASLDGELSAEADCDVDDVGNLVAEGNLHALEDGQMITLGFSTDGRTDGDKKRKCRKLKKPLLTLQDIEPLIRGGVLRDDAARQLKVSVSTLKRYCRDYGYQRWSGTQRRKSRCAKQQQCNTEHLHEMQETARTTLNQTSQDHETLVGCSSCSSTFDVKATYDNEKTEKIVRFKIESTSTIEQLNKKVSERLNLEISKFEIKYEDDEGQWVELFELDDLQFCPSRSSKSGDKRIDLKILDLK